MSAAVRASEVDTYQQARGGRWVARIDAPEVHGDAVAETQEHADLLAQGFRDALAAMRAQPPVAGRLVFPPDEWSAVKHVDRVLKGESG